MLPFNVVQKHLVLNKGCKIQLLTNVTIEFKCTEKFYFFARLNGYKDGTEMKVVSYESDTFVKEMEDTWNGLKPLYEQLHAYVRAKLLFK